MVVPPFDVMLKWFQFEQLPVSGVLRSFSENSSVAVIARRLYSLLYSVTLEG